MLYARLVAEMGGDGAHAANGNGSNNNGNDNANANGDLGAAGQATAVAGLEPRAEAALKVAAREEEPVAAERPHAQREDGATAGLEAAQLVQRAVAAAAPKGNCAVVASRADESIALTRQTLHGGDAASVSGEGSKHTHFSFHLRGESDRFGYL